MLGGKGRMKFTLAAITLFLIGYYVGGGAFSILEFLYALVWRNPLAEAFHNAVLRFDDARITDFYAALRLDFGFGIISVLVGFMCAIILPRTLDILPCFLVVGVVARMWVPLTIELIPQGAGVVAEFIPQFVWDIALIPACMLGTALGRLVRLRRVPRWRISSIGILTALLALLLTAIVQGPARLLPFAMCGLLGVVSIWILIQTNVMTDSRTMR
jgi:hypothetical protein